MPDEWIEEDAVKDLFNPTENPIEIKVYAFSNPELFEHANLPEYDNVLGFADFSDSFISEDLPDEFRATMLVDETHFINIFMKHLLDRILDSQLDDLIIDHSLVNELLVE